MTIASGAKIAFAESYVTGGTWVSGAPVTLVVPITVSSFPVELTIHHAVLSFVYTVDGSGQGHATLGVIAGVLVPSELIAAFDQGVGQFNGVFDSASDEVTNEPGEPCDAISIGLGFDADEIAAPSVVAPNIDASGPLPPCASGG